MANPKIEIMNYFNNLISRVNIDIEESLEKYNEEQVIGDLECYKSFKKKKQNNNLFELSESSLNKSYENKLPWLKEEKRLEEMLLKHRTNENRDDLEYDKIYKTVDLWSESTKVVDYLNQVRMRTIEELREAQKEALESYNSQSSDSKFYFQVIFKRKQALESSSQSDDLKSQSFLDEFHFQVRYTQSKRQEWIFKLFTFVTDFRMLPDDISFLEKLINSEDYEFRNLYGQDYDDSDKNYHQKMILIALFQKFFFENLNSEKFPSPLINVRKRDLLAIKQISFNYYVYCFNLNNSLSIDLSNLESLDIATTIEEININGLYSLESLTLRLHSLDYSSLKNLPSLRNLSIYLFSRIEEPFQSLIYNLPSLEHLTLKLPSDCMSNLSYFSLDSLVNLKSLSLSGTLHKDFNFYLFQNICNHLEILSIDFEKLDNECLAMLFYGHQFPIMKSFSIYLSDLSSKITKLEKKLFDRFPILQSLTINNKIGLRAIDLNAFSNLKQLISLDLSNCFIDSLDNKLFSGLKNLKYLNLSGNEINRIKAKQFSNFKNLRLLDLSNNQLCKFKLKILDYTKKIELIDLSENTIANKDAILGRIKRSNIKFDF